MYLQPHQRALHNSTLVIFSLKLGADTRIPGQILGQIVSRISSANYSLRHMRCCIENEPLYCCSPKRYTTTKISTASPLQAVNIAANISAIIH